ncbi:hypothetical protein [Pantoea agglomerans]|uniref:hypothetical protein n=1 Tax=Enterobacter agglomerans TaxID=549 RepID=UPI003209D738
MAVRLKMVTLMEKTVRKGYRGRHASTVATAVMAATQVTETQMAEAARPELMELTDE